MRLVQQRLPACCWKGQNIEQQQEMGRELVWMEEGRGLFRDQTGKNLDEKGGARMLTSGYKQLNLTVLPSHSFRLPPQNISSNL